MVPQDDNLRKWAKRYEGLMAFQNSDWNNKWYFDRDVFVEYITKGFPDVEALQPVMRLRAGIRYLQQFGADPSFKLKELRKILEARKWIIKSPNGPYGDRVSRTHLNRILGMWNGSR